MVVAFIGKVNSLWENVRFHREMKKYAAAIDEIDNRLNRGQQMAVLTPSRRVLVVAGAGSGKTKVLIDRIVHLVENRNVNPSSILAFTFTKNAAKEMQDRLEKKIGPNRVAMGTIHSFCYRLLRKHGHRLLKDEASVLTDNSDLITEIFKKKVTANKAYREKVYEFCRNYDTNEVEMANEVVKIINFAKSNDVKVEELRGRYKKSNQRKARRFYSILLPIYESYQKWIHNTGKLDFNDMVTLAVKLLEENRDVLEQVRKDYKYIMVDEFQDVSSNQVRLIKMLSRKPNELFAIGDDWQSIYGFRGSDPSFLVNFLREFWLGVTIPLIYNYRSNDTIVRASAEVIRLNKVRTNKKVKAFNEEQEGIRVYYGRDSEDASNFIIKKLDELEGDTALLYRNRSHFADYKGWLEKKNKKPKHMTIHASKGMEFDNVVIVGLKAKKGFPCLYEDSEIVKVIKPSDLDSKMDEERRLFYVAMTRAKKKLYLISEKGNVSRFIKEIPRKYLEEAT